MTAMTPSRVCEDLGIQASTLRKYSLLLEAEGVEFERTANNSRRYTEKDVITLRKLITLTETDGMTVKDAAMMASNWHQQGKAETLHNGVADNAPERHNGDMSLPLVAEIQKLRETVTEQSETIASFRKNQQERDELFLKVLEELRGEIQTLRAALPEPATEEAAADRDERLLTEPGEKLGDQATDKSVRDSPEEINPILDTSSDDVVSNDPITEKVPTSPIPKPKKGLFARLFGR